MAANAGEMKVKIWEGVTYPENMADWWQSEIDDILQVPFAYAIHDIDHDSKSQHRKTHVHIIVVWNGNTTRKAIINQLNRLSAPGKKCCSTAEPVNNIRHAYDYLIHATASCEKKGKERYPESARVEGNNFDIGALEQLSTADKQDMLYELIGVIMSEKYETINDVTVHVEREFPKQYREIVIGYNSILERYCRGNYQKAEKRRRIEKYKAKAKQEADEAEARKAREAVGGQKARELMAQVEDGDWPPRDAYRRAAEQAKEEAARLREELESLKASVAGSR